MTDVNDTGPSLAELRERKARREEEEAKAAEALEREVLLLEEKHANLGKIGKDYRILPTQAGCFVLRKPEFVVGRRFTAIPAEKRTEEDAITLATPCVVEPSRERFLAIMQEHGGVAWLLANEILEMYGAQAQARRGKS